MKQIMFEGNGTLLLLITSLIYRYKNGGILTNLVFYSGIEHTFALNTILSCFMTVVAKKNKSITKLIKMKSEYEC
jgi:hypothetical protein